MPQAPGHPPHLQRFGREVHIDHAASAQARHCGRTAAVQCMQHGANERHRQRCAGCILGRRACSVVIQREGDGWQELHQGKKYSTGIRFERVRMMAKKGMIMGVLLKSKGSVAILVRLSTVTLQALQGR